MCLERTDTCTHIADRVHPGHMQYALMRGSVCVSQYKSTFLVE